MFLFLVLGAPLDLHIIFLYTFSWAHLLLTYVGHTPCTAGTFQKKFRKDPGNALRAFPGIPPKSTAGIPKPYNSRHLKAPEHFQNSLPPVRLRALLFFRSGSGEGLSESVMEFPAVLGVFLITVASKIMSLSMLFLSNQLGAG